MLKFRIAVIVSLTLKPKRIFRTTQMSN